MPEQILFFINDNSFRIRDTIYQVEDFKKTYLNSDKRREDFAVECGITCGVLKKILAHYNIGRETGKVVFIDNDNFIVNNTRFEVKELTRQYIVNNAPLSYFTELWGISAPTFEKIISHYGIKKDPTQRSKNVAKTNIERYGCEWFTETDQMKSKSKETLLQHYGVTNIHKSAACQDKTKKTNMQKYGVEYAIASPIVREKIMQTNLERYGVTSTLQVKEVQEKIKTTNLKRYGVDYPLASKEIQYKISKTNNLRYHCTNPVQKNVQHYDIWSNDNLFVEYLVSGDEKTYFDLCTFFNVDDAAVWRKVRALNVEDKVKLMHGFSRYESEISDFLVNELHVLEGSIIRHDREQLCGKEIDLFIAPNKIGIEFNGDYWHSDIYKTDHNGRSTYHQDKSLLAESKGIFLFHIFEYEWNDPKLQTNIKQRLRILFGQADSKIAARKCEIVELNKNQKKEFLDLNHIQGNDHSSIALGLTYGGKLVSCMTFTHPKNQKYTWELSRFCNQRNTVVMGGASKLFKYFLTKLSCGDTVSSYNDITKTRGDLYKTLGFECRSVNDPNYIWMNFDTHDIRSRYQEQKAGEVTRMHSLGYHRICDCGTKTWVYTVK